MQTNQHPAAVKRFELITKLNEVSNNYFYYIFMLNSPQSPAENYRKYPNYMIEKWIFELQYGNIENEEMMARMWHDFVRDYEYYLGVFQQEEAERQQQYYYSHVQAQQTQPISIEGATPQQYDPSYNPHHQQQVQQYHEQQQQYVQHHQQHHHEGRQQYQENPHHHNNHGEKRTNYRDKKQPLHNKPYEPRPDRRTRDYYETRKEPGQNYLEILNETRSEPGPKKTAPRDKQPVIPEPEPKPVKKPDPPKPQPKPVKLSIEQIKEFINSVSKEELERAANPEVVSKAREINGWEMREEEVAPKEEFKFNRKESKNPKGNDSKGGSNDFKMGVRKDEATKAKEMGYQGNTSGMVAIKLGANETVETRRMKEEIRKMEGKDFATLMAKADVGLDELEKNRKEIVFNLNLIVPENLKEVERDLIQFLFDDPRICEALIEEIIKKAWEQPKYASTYAKLCEDFSKRKTSDFKFEGRQGAKKDNPFKFELIERVQHSFDQKIEKFREFDSPEEKEEHLKDIKKRILSNVKFIAELILHKVLKKRTIKSCTWQLFESFLRHYQAFAQHGQPEDATYDFHFEGIIEFIENVGKAFEEVDEKDKEKEKEREKPAYDYNEVEKHIGAVLKAAAAPDFVLLEKLELFTCNEYFHLLDFINTQFISVKHKRLSALLQNLEERRDNGWHKHLSMAEGPKTMKQIQQDILDEEHNMKTEQKTEAKEKERERIEQEKLDKAVKELFEGWEMEKHLELKEIKDILRKHNHRAFYLSFMKQVADQKKDKVIKRVALMEVVAKERFHYDQFRDGWVDAIRYLAIGSGDYPYSGAAMAKVLMTVLENDGKLADFHKNFDEDEEEDEVYFQEEVLQKYYHYSENEKALKYVKPKARLSHII